jgi:hypothetical protein
MSQQKPEQTAALFAGRWIGETQGCDMPAHVWEISARGRYLHMDTRWENQTGVARIYGEALPEQLVFRIGSGDGAFRAVLVDPQHFVIAGWDTNDARGGSGPSYDVVFSRPGVAELTARAAWEQFRSTHDARTAVESPE